MNPLPPSSPQTARKPPEGSSPDQVIVVVSDCHLSAGRFHEGRLNPHEDFFFDDEMADLFDHYSTGRYGDGPDGPVSVELVLAGDFLDPLNVAIGGEFDDAVTEEVSVAKIRAILAGHPAVCEAIRRFASKPGKSVTYLIGNHDADLLFPKVREEIIRAWDPEGRFPSEKIRIIHDTDRIIYRGGVEIRHGNQFESSSEIDLEKPFISHPRKGNLLNLPWSSIYVLKIVNRMKWEREFLDKIRPVKVFVLFGLVLDPWFTIRFAFLSSFYFLKTRIFTVGRRSLLRNFSKIMREESHVFQDLEREARKELDRQTETRAIIFGHTHRPMHKIYPDGKQYINTGTWTRMINLDWRGLGHPYIRTFALVEIHGDQPHCELRQWVGEHSPHKIFLG